MNKRILVLVVLILLVLLTASCKQAPSLDKSLRKITKPYSFSLLRWEASTLVNELKQTVIQKKVKTESATVETYFSLSQQVQDNEARVLVNQPTISSISFPDQLQQKQALITPAEMIIERQIRDVLNREGIYHPWDGYILPKISFPPINFKLDKPPNMLIISPRDHIESIRTITLLPDLTVDQMHDIEKQVDDLGYSSLIVGIGGMGVTFPTFVNENCDLRTTLNAATEEFLHQYLAFKPLGFDYVLHLLGIKKDYNIVSINETVASMVSQEIGTAVYKQNYAGFDVPKAPPQRAAFDFNAAMKDIRIMTDAYLARGEIALAEQFMKEKRDFLAGKGYYIRKLNQAYFAFYGSYTDSPYSPSPIGTKLRYIRDHSSSLKEFLNITSKITSLEALDKLEAEVRAKTS